MARKDIDTSALDIMEDEPQTETALAPRGETAIGSVNVDLDIGAIQLPRLQLTYGVGRLAEHFAPGDLVLGGDNLLAHKGESLEIIILSLDQFWKEYLSSEMYQSGLLPRSFGSKEEVLANGGTVKWVQGQDKPTFKPALDIKMLIAKPDGLTCGLFAIDLPDNKLYAPAVMTLDKTSYSAAGPGLVTICGYALAGCLLAGRFQLSTGMKPMGKNIVPVPSIKLMPDRNTPEVVAEIMAKFAGRATETVED